MYKEPHRRFLNYLQSKDLKCTIQRLRVLDVLIGEGRHLTVEEIHAIAREKDSSLGTATIYRTLKLLEDAGLVDHFDQGEGVVRFEVVDPSVHHDHLICESCGTVVEVLDRRIEKLQHDLAARHDFKLTGHRMNLYGLCRKCRKKAGPG